MMYFFICNQMVVNTTLLSNLMLCKLCAYILPSIEHIAEQNRGYKRARGMPYSGRQVSRDSGNCLFRDSTLGHRM